MKRTHPDRFWILLLAAIFALCAATSLWLNRAGGGRTLARITVDGQVVREIELSTLTRESRFELQTPHGSNTIALRPGGICVLQANCPDQVCVGQGWLEGGQVPIVCLPHRMVITLERGGDPDAFDAVSG